ncbi:MAG: hypothetical protein AAFR11_06730 [Pseudomonadota bacterium]
MTPVERYRDWIALQLEFAEAVQTRRGGGFGEVVRTHTNIHRRLGLGRPGDVAGAEWRAFVKDLRPGASGLNHTMRHLTKRFAPLEAGTYAFGWFGYSLFGETSVRLHFIRPPDSAETRPLAVAAQQRRRDELRALAEHVAGAHPGRDTAVGFSWLYNLERYRALFPPTAMGALLPVERPACSGAPIWCQFLDGRDGLRAEPAAEFRRRFAGLDPERPHLAFPLQPLRADIEVEAFLG